MTEPRNTIPNNNPEELSKYHIHYRETTESAELFCEQVRIADLVDEFGTPLYVYSQAQILDNFRAFKSSLQAATSTESSRGSHISYAPKANSNLEILRLLANEGSGADVVSGGELLAVLRAGFLPEKITFAGVGKTDDEIELGLRSNIHAFNVESVEELKVIDEIAGRIGVHARVAIRVNPDVDAKSHPYISTGLRENKFGIDLENAREAFVYAKSLPNLDVTGIHIHIGSQITTIDPFVKAATSLVQFVDSLRRETGIALEFLNFGGGQGVQYRNVVESKFLLADEIDPNTGSVPSLQEFVRSVLPILAKSGLAIMMEPGRAIVANSCALVTRTLFTKQNRLKRFVIVDAGMSDLIRPALYQAYHQIAPASLTRNKPIENVDVVGPICETGDFLAKNRALPHLERGDILAVLCAGAYGYSLANNYNMRPRAAEILVDGANYRVIREREDIEAVAGLVERHPALDRAAE
jgi:diaminopimelate decarboxylase